MANVGPLAAEICWRVWVTPTTFNRFRVLAALLHGSLVVGVSQTLWRWTEGATYIRQSGHHVGHWPTFIVIIGFCTTVFRKSYILFSAKSYRNCAWKLVVSCIGLWPFVGWVVRPMFSFVTAGLGWVSQLVGWVGLGQRKWTHGQLWPGMYVCVRKQHSTRRPLT